MNPPDLRYASTHEWVKREGEVATIGITKFAVEQLTEPTFLELPEVGKVLTAGKPLGMIESVKSTSDIYAPIAGTVIERNELLLDDKNSKRKADLSLVNDDPFGKGWLLKIKLSPGATLDHLMTSSKYDEQLASEGH
jgi:glycine cleavage system H protein